jgi:hypothetical protein
MRSAHQPDHLRGGEDDQRPGVPASRDAEPGQQPEAQPGDGCEHSGQVDQRRPRPTCSRRSSARPGAETARECRYTAHRGTRRSRTRRSRVLHVPPGRVANGPTAGTKVATRPANIAAVILSAATATTRTRNGPSRPKRASDAAGVIGPITTPMPVPATATPTRPTAGRRRKRHGGRQQRHPAEAGDAVGLLAQTMAGRGGEHRAIPTGDGVR